MVEYHITQKKKKKSLMRIFGWHWWKQELKAALNLLFEFDPSFWPTLYLIYAEGDGIIFFKDFIPLDLWRLENWYVEKKKKVDINFFRHSFFFLMCARWSHGRHGLLCVVSCKLTLHQRPNFFFFLTRKFQLVFLFSR